MATPGKTSDTALLPPKEASFHLQYEGLCPRPSGHSVLGVVDHSTRMTPPTIVGPFAH